MLRALLLGLLVVVPAASCSKGGDAPAAAVSASAGKVVEITGKVSATRDGKTRDLALGAEVFRDDQIATAADATVTIELFHNGAKWAVMANKTSRVDASLAWGLDKQEASKAVEHNSAAAGRNAEKSAADTQATTAMKDEERPSAAAEPSKPEPVAAPAVESAPAKTTAGAPPAPGGSVGGKGGPEKMKQQKEANEVPPPPPPPPPPAITESKKTEESAPKDTPKSAPRKMEADKAGIVISPQTLAEKQRPALAKCLGGKKAELKISVTAEKTTTAVTGAGVTADQKRCMDAIVQKIEWPLKGTFDLTLKFE